MDWSRYIGRKLLVELASGNLHEGTCALWFQEEPQFLVFSDLSPVRISAIVRVIVKE